MNHIELAKTDGIVNRLGAGRMQIDKDFFFGSTATDCILEKQMLVSTPLDPPHAGDCIKALEA